jgi:hypothetical protein
MGTFNFGTNPHAPSAVNASIVVEHEAGMTEVNGSLWVAVAETNVIDAQFLCQRLQFAMVVGHTDRANVVALRKQQF